MIDTSVDIRVLLETVANFDATVADRAAALGELIRRTHGRRKALRYSRLLAVEGDGIKWETLTEQVAKWFAACRWGEENDIEKVASLIVWKLFIRPPFLNSN